MKRLKGVVLILAMVFAVGMSNLTVQARTYKITLYPGETATHYCTTVTSSGKRVKSIKSIKSSKKKIVNVRKKYIVRKYNHEEYYQLIAKKKGTATVSVKNHHTTDRIKVTVKSKPQFQLTTTVSDDGNLTMQLMNKTSIVFNNVKVSAVYRDSEGNKLGKCVTTFSLVWPKGIVSEEKVNLVKDNYIENIENIDFDKTIYKIEGYDRSRFANPTDYTKKVKNKCKIVGDELIITSSIKKYKGIHSINVAFNIYFYDENGQCIKKGEGHNTLTKDAKSAVCYYALPEHAVSYKIKNASAFTSNKDFDISAYYIEK